MKKFVSVFVTLLLLAGLVTPSYASEKTNEVTKPAVKHEEKTIIKDELKLAKENAKMISDIEPYVVVEMDGTISLKEVPENLYKKYNLNDLEKHFENLNQLVESDNITINQDLSIEDNSISLFAVTSKWTYHWWGYDRNFTNSMAKAYASDLDALALGATAAGGLTVYFPPISGALTLTAAYYGLVSHRIKANNKGRGVYIGVTWARVFNVKPL